MRSLRVRSTPHNGHRPAPCKNHDLCTNPFDPYKTRLYAVHIICAKWRGDMAVYGYARVSTDGQSLSAQLAELKAGKCTKIFQEKISGVRWDRKQLTRLMSAHAKGDVL